MADANFMVNAYVGYTAHSFNIGINNHGNVWQSGDTKKVNFGPDGFANNDVVGCGLMITQKTKNADETKCEPCIQQPCKLFFTKNGQLWGIFILITY